MHEVIYSFGGEERALIQLINCQALERGMSNHPQLYLNDQKVAKWKLSKVSLVKNSNY